MCEGERRVMAARAQGEQVILVVEDDPTTREGLDRLLREEGCRVISAANGHEALGRLHAGLRPDLILLDMFMPILDGWQFLAALRHDRLLADTPILLTTAAPLSREWAHDHGCAGCIRKPINVGQLLAEIRHCLKSRAGN